MPDPIRILIVDDHPVVRDGLLSMLSNQPEFDVVGTAGDGSEALMKIARFEPDVMLLDLEMPILDGIEVLQRLRAEGQTPNTIVFTAFDTDERILTAIRAGAKGYMLKGAPREELFHAIRVASQGGSLLQPLVASKLFERLAGSPHQAAPYEPLTDREQEVMALLARGMTNKEIAAELHITERTVKFHVSSILGKLGAANRTEAVTLAAQQGLIDL